ncbi:MAG: PepSY domain-containing protein [Pseudomonadota bacterium]|nr:PepSY domain-containing protein [Pseudomonadota bacterium]
MRDFPQRRRFRSLYLWHRYIGLSAAIFIVLLAVTGVFLQHTAGLGLERQYVNNRLLLRWYGIKPNPVVSYRTANFWVSGAGEFIYLDGKPVEGEYGDLKGAIEDGPLIIVVSDESVVLLTRSGEFVERLEAGNGLPEAVLGISRSVDGAVVVRGHTRYWRPDADWLQWSPWEGPHPRWNTPGSPPGAVLEQISDHNLAHEITWERLLLDLHSGRVLGIWGVYLMDLAAVAMLLLAASGAWVWFQRRPQHHARRR